MPPNNFLKDSDSLPPIILHPQEEYEGGKYKAYQKLQDHRERSQKELDASNIFSHIFNTWRPGPKKLLLLYQRQSVSVNAKTALTARLPTILSYVLGWSFQVFDSSLHFQNISIFRYMKRFEQNLFCKLKSCWITGTGFETL